MFKETRSWFKATGWLSRTNVDIQVNVNLVKKIDGGTGSKVRIVESRLVN